ncbi:MAG: radical SAM protein [Candidatus Omnitrophota bacterium]
MLSKQFKQTLEKLFRPSLPIQMLHLLLSSDVLAIRGNRKAYPKVLQLPITNRCNSRCVMCNIWTMDHSQEMSSDELSRFLKDPIFKDIRAVGINGGEPSLLKNLPEYTQSILQLPKINSLNIISHGFNPDLLCLALRKIFAQCKKKGVRFHLSISLDGVGEKHDEIRGLKGVFARTFFSIKEIQNNRHLYCHSFDVACTVIKQNVDHLIALDEFAKENHIDIKYRLGIKNKRIQSDLIVDRFSVLSGQEKQSAKEFFFRLFKTSRKLSDKFKYFSIFYFLNNTPTTRLLGCDWKEEGITLDAKGNLYYCAVASKSLGSLREKDGKEIFLSNDHISYRKNLIIQNCDQCIHDYCGGPQLKDVLIFLKFVLFDKFYCSFYRIKELFS